MPTFSGKGDCLYHNKEVEFVYLADLVGCGAFPFLSKMIRLRALRKFIIGNAPDVVVSFQVRKYCFHSLFLGQFHPTHRL